MTNPVHPKTGAPLYRGIRPLTLTYAGHSITIDMPGWYGDDPDEGIFDPQDTKISDRALNRIKARAENLLEPEQIKRIRKKLNLTQEAAGNLIGGGPRAFQKYESGDLLPSRAITTALVLLDRDPTALNALEEAARKLSVDRMQEFGGMLGFDIQADRNEIFYYPTASCFRYDETGDLTLLLQGAATADQIPILIEGAKEALRQMDDRDKHSPFFVGEFQSS